jgi:hypothetical protein
MNNSPENKGWEQEETQEVPPLIRYIRQIPVKDRLGLEVGLVRELDDSMLPRDFVKLPQGNIWDLIHINEVDQVGNDLRPLQLLRRTASALKPSGTLVFKGSTTNEDMLDLLDSASESILDKVKSEVVTKRAQPIYFNIEWQKREDERLRIHRGISLLLSTLMEP